MTTKRRSLAEPRPIIAVAPASPVKKTVIQTEPGALTLRSSVPSEDTRRYQLELRQETGQTPLGFASTILWPVSAHFDDFQALLRARGFKEDDKIGYLVEFYPYEYIPKDSPLKGRGIAALTLAQIEKDLADAGALTIILETPTDVASNFYEQHQYMQIGARGSHRYYIKEPKLAKFERTA